jgi:hypothetical protein
VRDGPRELVIRAVDGVVMRLPRAWTDADGGTVTDAGPDAVFTVEAIRALMDLVAALRGAIEVRASPEACQGPKEGPTCPRKRVSTCGGTDWPRSGDACRSERGVPSWCSTRA